MTIRTPHPSYKVAGLDAAPSADAASKPAATPAIVVSYVPVCHRTHTKANLLTSCLMLLFLQTLLLYYGCFEMFSPQLCSSQIPSTRL